MDIVSSFKSVLAIIQMPINLVSNERTMARKLRNGLEDLKDDLDIIKEDLKSYEELKMQELIYDIEDFAQGLWIPGASGPVLSAIGMDPREEHLERIKYFKEKIEKLQKQQQKSTQPGSGQGACCSAVASSSSEPSSSSAAETYTAETSLVGIDDPKMALLDLLKPASTVHANGQGARQQLKVISIVGCHGIGKTALARAVYDHCCASSDFDCVAWVVASGCNNKTALLRKVLEAVLEASRERSGDGTVTSSDSDLGILADKRYLVFIDDVQQAKVLKDIVRDFPENGKGSMLIVTTCVQLVARVCSSGSYMYTMQCLPKPESEKLLWGKVRGRQDNPGSALCNGSESILSICDGLPLALISVAQYLSLRGNLDSTDCADVAKVLGSHYLADTKSEEEFGKLRRALEQCYESLPDLCHKTSMLSLSIFPRDSPIKSKSLVRRLIAEGLAEHDAQGSLDELINRCVVKPVQICSNSKVVKRCQVNDGVMLEFIVHKSKSKNLVTLIRKEEVLHNQKGRIRRLSVQSSTIDKFHEVAKNYGLSGMRSLTIFSIKLPIPSKKRSHLFKDCKFLRLLDLEGCSGLDNKKLLGGICALVYLKYLSLRNTDVKNIPHEIKNLKCLQTLDIRETREMIQLPTEVIMLPELAFLFGQFVLPEMSSDTIKFLSTESKLHTLAGFVVDKAQGFEEIIPKARNLKKVKVWCRETCATPKLETSSAKQKNSRKSLQTIKNDFVLSLQQQFTFLESVSIHSTQISHHILASLEKRPCTISCMKLWGKLGTLPEIGTLSQLHTLSKLQLSYTECSSDDLSILQHISCLEYLKLQDNKTGSWGGSFVVHEDGFESLRRLCFQAPKLPKLQFKTGAMKNLTSLHLLCKDISQMQVAEEIGESISHITSLNEVVLHYSATENVLQAWNTAANGSANRPSVKKQTKPISTAASPVNQL